MSFACPRGSNAALTSLRLYRSSRIIPKYGKPTAITNQISPSSQSQRLLSGSASRSSDGYLTTPFCPEPTCECAETPELEINRTKSLINSIPPYHQHVVISTGRTDWTSRIERAVDLAAGIKKGIGPKGPYYDSHRNVMITNSSFEPPVQGKDTRPRATALLFPSFQTVENILDDEPGHEDFIKSFIQREPDASKANAFSITPITKPVVLICSHGSRDKRCGIMGPLLYSEVIRQLENLGLGELNDHVGMCSHIGGHKWAGNLIIYIPPNWTSRQEDGEGTASLLAGKGVWYGRVEPKHVEGLMHETIVKGRVVENLCRGMAFRSRL